MSLISGDIDASVPTGMDASVPSSPHVELSNDNCKQMPGRVANRHSAKDNEDILYSYLWAQNKARLTSSGYINHMLDKWNVLRPDKPLSKSALATKGKRLHDRAMKDLGGKEWLSLAVLEEIRGKVAREFAGFDVGVADSNPGEADAPLVGDDEYSSHSFEQPKTHAPVGVKPCSDEFKGKCSRAKAMFAELKGVPIDEQGRRKIKKKSFSNKIVKWIDWATYELLSELNDIESSDISVLNTVLYVVAAVFTFREGQELCVAGNVSIPKKNNDKLPAWKERLQGKVSNLRKEADILKASLDERLKKSEAIRYRDSVYKKYAVDGSRKSVEKLLFKLKSSISAIAAKIRRYEIRNKSKEQNECFIKDKKKFYRSIFEEGSSVSEVPKEEDIRRFWEDQIWGDSELYTKEPEWIDDIRKSCKLVPEQEWADISAKDLADQMAGQMNWKSAGIDCIPNFWLKNAPCCYTLLAYSMNECLKCPEKLPKWIVCGRTVLLPKSSKTSDPSHYRPITCLSTFWKLLSGILAEKISLHLNKYSIIAREQQGAVKKSYGTKTQLLINKSIFEDAFRKRKNLSMCYIDYAKAYDSVPHKWIIETLAVYKINSVILRFLAHSMSMWHTNMFLYHKNGVICVDNIMIKRGIFQGDTLSPLLFIIAINPLSLLLNRRCSGYTLSGLNVTHSLYMDDLKGFCSSYASLRKMVLLIESFSHDIGMSLGLSKCKVVNLRAGKYASLGGVELAGGGVVEELKTDEVYKFLGVEELDGIRHDIVKAKAWANAKTKLRKLLESELNSRNLFQAINECIVPILSYSFGIVHWLESDVKELDIKIRKMLHMYRVFEIKSDVDRLYLSRRSGGRGLLSIWDVFQCTICRVAHYLANSQEDVLMACAKLDSGCLFSVQKKAQKFSSSNAPKLPENFGTKPLLAQARLVSSVMRASITESRELSWKEKPQHGAFRNLLVEHQLSLKKSFLWLSKCHIDPGLESYVCAAQELALFTRYHEKYILKSRLDDRCRICKKESETIFHILAGCGVLAKRDYFDRHNAVCKYVHFEILKHYAIPCGTNWFVHTPRDVIIASNVEIIYDQVLTTDREVGANRPDILVRDKTERKTYIIDISCPCDVNVIKKEAEKISKYGTLKRELTRMWGEECLVVPVVIGGLGAVSNDTELHLEKIPGNISLAMCQKITLMGSKKILNDVLARQDNNIVDAGMS